MKPESIVKALKKGIEKKNCKAIMAVYRAAEKIDWERVKDEVWKEYDELISPANDLLYENSYTNIHQK